MVRKRAPPSQILVPQRSPRPQLKEAIRTVESDGEFSSTREDFDFDELPDSPEIPVKLLPPKISRRIRHGDAALHGSDRRPSAFRRIMQDEYADSAEAPLFDHALRDGRICEYPAKLQTMTGYDNDEGYKSPDRAGYTCSYPRSPCVHPVPRMSPPISPVSPLANIYRPSEPSTRRILAIFVLFIWLTYLHSQEDGYYTSVPIFAHLYAISGASLFAELVMCMPKFSHGHGHEAGWCLVAWKVLRRITIALCYLAVGVMVYVRASIGQ